MPTDPQSHPTAIGALIDEVDRSHTRLAATLATLTDADLRAPAALPGWTRGHVLAHLARSADAYGWLLTVARTGVEPSPRAGAAALARAVADGAARPAAEQSADVRASFTRLTEDARTMPAAAWDTRVTALAGWSHPASFTLHRCWRELETHHVDLAAGYGTADWPARYVAWALDGTLAALAVHDFPLSRVEAVDLGRAWTVSAAGPTVTGPGHVLLGWLSGRAPDGVLGADGRPVSARRLPVPPAWPLPPTPGWPGPDGTADGGRRLTA
ncbi:hypothetical protein GCM10010211_27440 [Streptomyces albospinus]|uniref:Mycothiol-dependent maleylpyruvate isomerase metal-binding domain-containing protein n=1 Tax=Streptomyces albospinus TaxID=285515 RepID=A0ABQ2V0P7_9ACTN|nr:maleylpyruvate isomerase family mycothiol-dependent enzyme [Streptomyces albospinus]GGU61070.1 hypothetical protein GCM10010211_27440 [Streptomyces albospinus]